MALSTNDIKTKPFVDIAWQLILFGMTVSLGVAMVKALSSSFEAAFAEDFEGPASAWLCFICILLVSATYTYVVRKILIYFDEDESSDLAEWRIS